MCIAIEEIFTRFALLLMNGDCATLFVIGKEIRTHFDTGRHEFCTLAEQRLCLRVGACTLIVACIRARALGHSRDVLGV